MTVTFTLSSLYTGATYVAGPFNIFAVTNTGASTQVATGVTKEQLAAGHVVSGIDDATTGGTINSTGTCTNSYPWYVSAPEPTPTATAGVTAECWSMSYTTTNPPPNDLYVRYRDYNGTVQTTLLSGLVALDLGNGSVLVGLCVSLSGAYSTPVWVQGGVEITTEWLWSNNGTPCTTNGECLLN